MTNPFYNYGQASGNAIVPGMLGRAESVAAELQAVQAGFADLATTGTDSGVANAYVVTTPVGEPAAYADGDQITFKPQNTNSGASTINVNGAGNANILRFDGSGLQADDLLGGSWYTLTYNSTYGAWTLPSSTSTITYAGVITGAAPVHLVGLSAVGGTSTAAAPIDAQYALSTAISPSWVGNHTFNGTSSFAGPTTISGTASISGPLTISGLTTHSGITVFTNAVQMTGTATLSGVLAVSGTSSFSGALTVSGTSSVSGPWTCSGPLNITGTSSLSGPTTISGTLAITGLTTFAPGSLLVSQGTATFQSALTATGVTTLGILNVTGVATVSAAITALGTGSASGPWTFSGPVTVSGTSTISGPLSVSGTATFGNQVAFTHAIVTNAVVVNAPTSGTALYVNATSGTHSTVIEDSAGNAFLAGFLEIPVKSESAAYQLIISDSGKTIYHPASDSTARTFTIPANSNVAFNVGTTVSFVNLSSANVTIAITTDTLLWAPSGSTGSRTLAQYGVATITKIAATEWILTGVGVT